MGLALAFDPLAELVQVVHGAVLAQLDLGLVALQGGRGGEGLLQGEHHLVHLERERRRARDEIVEDAKPENLDLHHEWLKVAGDQL